MGPWLSLMPHTILSDGWYHIRDIQESVLKIAALFLEKLTWSLLSDLRLQGTLSLPLCTVHTCRVTVKVAEEWPPSPGPTGRQLDVECSVTSGQPQMSHEQAGTIIQFLPQISQVNFYGKSWELVRKEAQCGSSGWLEKGGPWVGDLSLLNAHLCPKIPSQH